MRAKVVVSRSNIYPFTPYYFPQGGFVSRETACFIIPTSFSMKLRAGLLGDHSEIFIQRAFSQHFATLEPRFTSLSFWKIQANAKLCSQSLTLVPSTLTLGPKPDNVKHAYSIIEESPGLTICFV